MFAILDCYNDCSYIYSQQLYPVLSTCYVKRTFWEHNFTWTRIWIPPVNLQSCSPNIFQVSNKAYHIRVELFHGIVSTWTIDIIICSIYEHRKINQSNWTYQVMRLYTIWREVKGYFKVFICIQNKQNIAVLCVYHCLSVWTNVTSIFVADTLNGQRGFPCSVDQLLTSACIMCIKFVSWCLFFFEISWEYTFPILWTK